MHTHTQFYKQINLSPQQTVVPESVSTTKHQIIARLHLSAHATSHPLPKNRRNPKFNNRSNGLLSVRAKNSNFSIYLSISFHLCSSPSWTVTTVSFFFSSCAQIRTNTQQRVHSVLLANILICSRMHADFVWFGLHVQKSVWRALFSPLLQIFTDHLY